MDFLLQTILPYIVAYKYVAVFIVSFLAAFIVPIPSGSILMATSAFSTTSFFNIYWLIIISIIGNIAGDNVGYWVARRYGSEVLAGIGFRRILNSKKIKNIEVQFNKRPGFIIFISRFEVLATLSVNLLSGISKTSYKKYFLYESIGSISQVCMYAMLGYFFADNWKLINSIVGRVSLVVILILVLAIISYSKKNLIRKLNKID